MILESIKGILSVREKKNIIKWIVSNVYIGEIVENRFFVDFDARR